MRIPFQSEMITQRIVMITKYNFNLSDCKMGSVGRPGLSSSRPHHLTSIHYTLSEIAKCFYQDKKNAFLCLNCFVVIRAAD